MRYALGVSAGILISAGMLAGQWLNMPVQIPASGHAFTEADVLRMRSNEKEAVRRQQDALDAARVFRAISDCHNASLSDIVARAAHIRGLSPRVVAATIVVESSCKSVVLSRSGAIGLMQIDRHTWPQYSRQELLDPARNVEVGTTILASYVRQTGSTREGLKRYFGVTPGSTASDDYADKILARASRRN